MRELARPQIKSYESEIYVSFVKITLALAEASRGATRIALSWYRCASLSLSHHKRINVYVVVTTTSDLFLLIHEHWPPQNKTGALPDFIAHPQQCPNKPA